MTSAQLAALIRRLGDANDAEALAALLRELCRRWPNDADALRLTRVIEHKARRLAGRN